MAIIKKKTWPDYFDLVSSGKKRIDVRVNDFDIKEGDALILEEWDPKTKKYTGRKIEREIDYVLKFDLNSFNQKDEINEKGILVIQFKNCNNGEEISCKKGLTPNLINEEVFEREIELCKKLFKENKGKCCWGSCQECGVPLFLYKLYKGEVIDEEKEINELRKKLFN